MISEATTVDDAVRQVAGDEVVITSRQSVSGGCIANGQRVKLSNGTSLFLKSSATLPPAMFPAEALGLSALRSGAGPRVPEPFAVFPPPGDAEYDSRSEAFILMEWVDAARPGPGFHQKFGRDLAELHRTVTSSRCGFDVDNFIGSTPQPNLWTDDWLEFFATHRLGFQTRLALDRGRIDRRVARDIESICSRLSSLLPDVETKSMLHGDLWGGNYLCDSHGDAVLIDPAVYYGHREADLAMTELFGGFSPEFYRAYNKAFPLEPGYSDRSDLYNLYHMLNHLNLFGAGYLGSVRSIVGRYV